MRELTQRELPLRERPPLQARPDSRRRPLMDQDPVDVDVEPYLEGDRADEPAPRRRTDYEDPW